MENLAADRLGRASRRGPGAALGVPHLQNCAHVAVHFLRPNPPRSDSRQPAETPGTTP